MSEQETMKVEAAYAAFRGVKLHFGLILDEVRLVSDAVHMVRDPFAIELEKPADVEVEISQESLGAFLESQSPGGLRNFQVRCHEGHVYVDAVARMIVDIPASAVCALRIEAGKQLFVDLVEVNVLGAGPKQLVQKQLDAINPVFDLSDLPVDGHLDSSEIAEGKILLRGKLAPIPK